MNSLVIMRHIAHVLLVYLLLFVCWVIFTDSQPIVQTDIPGMNHLAILGMAGVINLYLELAK